MSKSLRDQAWWPQWVDMSNKVWDAQTAHVYAQVIERVHNPNSISRQIIIAQVVEELNEISGQ